MKCYESRPTENHEGRKHRRTRNGRELIKSLVNWQKYKAYIFSNTKLVIGDRLWWTTDGREEPAEVSQ